MKSLPLLLFLNLIFSSGLAQVQSEAFKVLLETMLKKDVPTLSCNQLKLMKNVILLDTRAKREFEVSHLKDAIWLGDESNALDKLKNIPKDANVVVYCSIGVRSEKEGEKLLKYGYKNVHNLYGGIFEWLNEGNPIVDAQQKSTNKIHAYNRVWGIWVNKGEKVYE